MLPLEFTDGQTRQSLGLTGFETITVEGLSERITPRSRLTVVATGTNGTVFRFQALARIDTPEELHYFRHGGILPYVLRQLAGR